MPAHSRRIRTALAAAVTAAALIGSAFVAAPANADDGAITPPAEFAIAGDMKVGSTVSIPAEGWAPAETVLSVAWFVGDHQPIVEPEGQTADLKLDLLPDYLGQTISAEVTATAEGLEATTTPLTAAGPVAAGAFASTPAPVIVGHTVGATSTISMPDWAPAATYAYEWAIDGVAISKDAAYTPVGGDQGKSLTVTVTGSATGYESVSKTSEPVVVGAGTFTSSATPAIAGVVRVGSVLTAVPGTWPAESTLSYQWKVSGVVVSTAQKFAPTPAQRGKSVQLTVTASRLGYESVSTSTAAYAIGYGVFAATAKVSGPWRVGATLTAATAWSPAATKSYQWLRNGVAITGAKYGTYKVTRKDLGKRISVRVKGTSTSYTTKVITSAATPAVVKPFLRTTAPTVTGTKRVGAVLTAHKGSSWSPYVTSSAWQWMRNGVAIPGARSATYRLTASDYAKKITVVYTGKRSGYWSTPRSSAATAAIAGPAAVVTTDGLYRVGVKIQPGTYYANAPVGCVWARLDSAQNIIGGGVAFAAGRQIVTISKTDYWFGTKQCGAWTPLLKLTAAATRFGNGMHAVGITVAPGTYVNSSPTEQCFSAMVSGFGGTDDEVIDWFEGAQVLYARLDASSKGIESYDCGTWTRVGD